MNIDCVLSRMSPQYNEVFNMIDARILERINEIRIHKNGYILLVVRNSVYFVDYNGDLYDRVNNHCVKINAGDFDKLFMSLCDYSLHSHMDTLKSGYLTLENGFRIGVSGCAVYEDSRLVSVKDITSLNIRIPQNVKGCAAKIVKRLYEKSLPSIIVAGMPNSGKTTLLRDLARSLSDGEFTRCVKLALIDERRELSAFADGNGAGFNTDVLSCFKKATGIEIAARTLSPEMIVCDEIASLEELKSIMYAFSSGIAFALSVHIGNKEELYTKPILQALLETGEFSYIVLLEGCTYKYEIIDVSEVLSEISGSNSFNGINNGNRNYYVI